MKEMFLDISRALEAVKWRSDSEGAGVTGFPDPIPPEWPIADKLTTMLMTHDEQGRSLGDHVRGVVASVNALRDPLLNTAEFLVRSGDPAVDGKAIGLMAEAHNRSWFHQSALFGGIDNEFAKGLLLIAALYHDVGQLISAEHHVSRGVHLMRDVSQSDRRQIEDLFEAFGERNSFWALLRHHDVYGCFCTGEASLPAMSDMVTWTLPGQSSPSLDRSVPAYLTYLLWLNIADVDARLRPVLGGITTVEARRYLMDWVEIREYLLDEQFRPRSVKREEFRNWSLAVAGHPERTIRRIARIVATCYRKEMKAIPPESEIQVLVEEELCALHGPRVEAFCYRFSRFCKLDYALRFFYLVMRDALLDEELVERADDTTPDAFPAKVRPAVTHDSQRVHTSLRNMVDRTCLVLGRIVEDYGHLVAGEERSSPLLGVDMSGLMRPGQTGWAICQSLKRFPPRALGWIADEIGVWLYGE